MELQHAVNSSRATTYLLVLLLLASTHAGIDRARAGDLSPVSVDIPLLSECQVSPRSSEDIMRVVNDVYSGQATGDASSDLVVISGTIGEVDASIGQTLWIVDGRISSSTVLSTLLSSLLPETSLEITAVLREYTACGNAGDLRRAFSLLTDRALAQTIIQNREAHAGITPADFQSIFNMPPQPLPSERHQAAPTLIQASGLPDGRVAVILAPGTPDDDQSISSPQMTTLLYLFAPSNDTWRIDAFLGEVVLPS